MKLDKYYAIYFFLSIIKVINSYCGGKIISTFYSNVHQNMFFVYMSINGMFYCTNKFFISLYTMLTKIQNINQYSYLQRLNSKYFILQDKFSSILTSLRLSCFDFLLNVIVIFCTYGFLVHYLVLMVPVFIYNIILFHFLSKNVTNNYTALLTQIFENQSIKFNDYTYVEKQYKRSVYIYSYLSDLFNYAMTLSIYTYLHLNRNHIDNLPLICFKLMYFYGQLGGIYKIMILLIRIKVLSIFHHNMLMRYNDSINFNVCYPILTDRPLFLIANSIDNRTLNNLCYIYITTMVPLRINKSATACSILLSM